MKILFVTHMFPLHPEDKNCKFIYDSICALHELGHEVQVLITKPWKPKWIFRNQSNEEIQVNQFPQWLKMDTCYFISFPRYYFYAITLWNYKLIVSSVIKRLILERSSDVIHVHSEAYAATIANVGRKLNIPTLVTIHGAETNLRYWRAAKKIIIKGIERINKVILVGQSIKKLYDKMSHFNEHFKVIHNGFSAPLALYTHNHRRWEQQLHCVSVCTLSDEGKGIDINLRALAKLAGQGITHWVYTIVGDGCFKRELEVLAKTLNIHNQVKFVGACDHNEIFKYLLEANIFCLPSYREAFGIAHLEAMASGLLVIGVEGQGPEAFIIHDKTGLLVKPKNVESLVESLKYAFSNSEKMQLISRAGKEFAWRHFTWLHHAQSLSATYQELVN